jgi:hypothetical protein
MAIENGSPDTVKVEEGNTTETQHVEVVRTISRVPGNPNYYEKEGLRTEGDGMDHTHYNSVSYTILIVLTIHHCHMN